jgi:hypothetical protein
MEYRPLPVIVEASANRDWCVSDAKERNAHYDNRHSVKRRFKVYSAATEVTV